MLRESQQVAFDSEILDTLPKLYANREEQVTLELECRGSSGKSCQGAALITIQVGTEIPLTPVNLSLKVSASLPEVFKRKIMPSHLTFCSCPHYICED